MYVILFLLYLSDISEKLQRFGSGMFEAGMIVLTILVLIKVFLTIMGSIKETEQSFNAKTVDSYITSIIKSKLFAFLIVMFLLLKLFTPSEKMLQILAGLYAGSTLLEQPAVNSLLDKSYKILDSKLDEILKESNIELKPLGNKQSL